MGVICYGYMRMVLNEMGGQRAEISEKNSDKDEEEESSHQRARIYRLLLPWPFLVGKIQKCTAKNR